MRAGPNLPAAAQCPVDLDEAESNVAARLGQQVLLLHKVLLQQCQLGESEVDITTPVQGEADINGFLGGIDAFG